MLRLFYFIVVFIVVTTNRSFAQISFNDLLVISELKQVELIDGFLTERNFVYKGKIEKDNEGYTVETWTFVKGTAWLEYKSTLQVDTATNKLVQLHVAVFYTTSTKIFNTVFNEMKNRSWKTVNKEELNGSNMEGFKSHFFSGETTFYAKTKFILVGVNENYRGTTAYRIFLF